jgi:SAM-dependent methyltransferase
MAEEFDEQFWDERYQSRESVWSGDPNLHLVTETAGLAPGLALDVGCGEGADAIWLGERGWEVTAVDWSRVALARAEARALAAGTSVADRITWLHADLRRWVPERAYDLVSSHYTHLPPAERTDLFGRLADAVAPGGTLLIVAHHPNDLHTSMARPDRPDLFWTAEEIADTLDAAQWRVLVSDARERSVTNPHGQPVTITDAVLRAQRVVVAPAGTTCAPTHRRGPAAPGPSS